MPPNDCEISFNSPLEERLHLVREKVRDAKPGQLVVPRVRPDQALRSRPRHSRPRHSLLILRASEPPTFRGSRPAQQAKNKTKNKTRKKHTSTQRKRRYSTRVFSPLPTMSPQARPCLGTPTGIHILCQSITNITAIAKLKHDLPLLPKPPTHSKATPQ